MTYNIHPIFVHFPVALLSIYSLVKILPLKKWFPLISWKHIEVLLLIIGVAGSFMALATGEIAERLIDGNRQIIEAHSMFAKIATFIYILLLSGEILPFLLPVISSKFNFPRITNFLVSIRGILTNNVFSITLAFLGLIAISITGLLGAVIVYGVSADPIAGFVLQLLGLSQ